MLKENFINKLIAKSWIYKSPKSENLNGAVAAERAHPESENFSLLLQEFQLMVLTRQLTTLLTAGTACAESRSAL